VTYLPYVLAVWIFLVALFGIVTSRNLVHIAVCVSVAQSATYVLLLAVGYRTHGTAPIFSVVQALTLTDIVVSVAVAALLLAFAIKSFDRTGSLDPSEIAELHG
jgi:multicomponent Na+:H+ antiporter subunit C